MSVDDIQIEEQQETFEDRAIKFIRDEWAKVSGTADNRFWVDAPLMLNRALDEAMWRAIGEDSAYDVYAIRDEEADDRYALRSER